MEKVITNNVCIVRKLKSYKIEILHRNRLGKFVPNSFLKKINHKVIGKLTITLSYRRMIFMFLDLKQNLEDICWMFLLYTLTTTHVFSTKTTHKNHILLYSPLPGIFIPVMATPRKPILLLIRLQKILKVMNHIIEPEILQPSLIYVVLIIHIKNMSQPQTMNPHKNRCPNHDRGRMTHLRRVKLTTLL